MPSFAEIQAFIASTATATAAISFAMRNRAVQERMEGMFASVDRLRA